MQSSLKKSLYLGLAALSISTSAAALTGVNASAATLYTPMTTDAETRNVQPTGKNALYSSPRAHNKHSKVIASKSTMAKLAASKSSKDYFRAYGSWTTSNGVYYKVVSFDGKYRGYVWGGSVNGQFAGGIESAKTLTEATMPSNTTMYLKKAGTQNVTWTAPKWTQYKAEKKVQDMSSFGGDKFTVTAAATKTREGGQPYYKVTDVNHPSISGWIYSGALQTTPNEAQFDATKDVKVNFNIDGKTVASQIFTDSSASEVGTLTSTDKLKEKNTAGAVFNQATVDALLKGKGAKAVLTDTVNANATKVIKTGDTVTITAYANDKLGKTDLDAIYNGLKFQSVDKDGNYTAETVTLDPAFKTAALAKFDADATLMVPSDSTVANSVFLTALQNANGKSFVANISADGKSAVRYEFKQVTDGVSPIDGLTSGSKILVTLNKTKLVATTGTTGHGATGQDNWTVDTTPAAPAKDATK